MDSPLSPDVLHQIEKIPLKAGQPLVISDADEVLFAFMAGFEAYLLAHDLFFDWSSFALTGNIRRKSDTEPIAPETVKETLEGFFSACTETLDPVPGAALALESLKQQGAQIVVLSNIPVSRTDARKRALKKHRMNYPLVANAGSKGAAVKHLADLAGGPTVFLDDIPHHHTAVATTAEDVFRLHFVADPRLAKLLGPAEHCHHRTDDWPEAQRLIEQFFTAGNH